MTYQDKLQKLGARAQEYANTLERYENLGCLTTSQARRLRKTFNRMQAAHQALVPQPTKQKPSKTKAETSKKDIKRWVAVVEMARVKNPALDKICGLALGEKLYTEERTKEVYGTALIKRAAHAMPSSALLREISMILKGRGGDNVTQEQLDEVISRRVKKLNFTKHYLETTKKSQFEMLADLGMYPYPALVGLSILGEAVGVPVKTKYHD